ncbi:CIA30 family protein [Oscillatoria sp. CS-180]|uniref:CIA30 family protein n=1 Tax=Oscillatoria sp. CS-180 TaxID=3021720 RepID=UPI00232E53A7|nr:CIA30 family protein [Oscillatoria sp. CS-180]MDB9528223.1 CIA30 family protein [Oscillatoria sp. CS-180]
MTQSSDRWNPFRLVDTLNFFGEVPFVGNIRWLQQMFGAASNPQAPATSEIQPESEIVLLSDEGPEADALTTMLRNQGKQVRSQIQPADSPLPETAPNRIVNTQAIVWKGVPDDEECLSAQIDDLTSLPTSEEHLLFDFRMASSDGLGEIWGAVDDVVMGGASASGLSILPGYARFAGNVSTANSGGFASVRTRNFEPPFNLQNWQGIRLVLRGDGQRYKVILRNSNSWDSLAYCTSVDTEAEQWIGIDVPFAALSPTFRAKTQPTAPPLDPKTVCSFQLMLSKFEYDGNKNPHFRPGAFFLDIRSIGVYRAASAPKFVAIASSPSQAETYITMLAQSGLPHQVLVKTEPSFAEKLGSVIK